MGRVLVFVLVAALIAGILARGNWRSRRAKIEAARDSTPELNKHPERLDQMLDPTDDA